MAAGKKKRIASLRQGYKELEEIVTDFESREIDLEKDLPKFERGLELAAQLKQRISELENTVVEIENKYDDPENSNSESEK